MSQNGFDRRAFLKTAQMTALVGAVGAGSSLSAAADSATTPDGKFDFDTPYNRIGTNSIKWDAPMTQYGLSSIVAGMGVADMDFRCAPSITQALQERIKHEVWGYLDMPKNFVDGIVSWNKRRYGIDIPADNVGITTGVHPGIVATLEAFCAPGTNVMLTTPVYAGFYGDLQATGLVPNESLMKFANGRYSIDFDDFEKRINRNTSAFILCNPHNPTGNMWSREDLTKLGEICLRRRVLVLADEIHCDFATKGAKYVPFASLENRDIVNNSITFKAASKSFGLAAMKCAWFFSTNPDIMAAVKKVNRADLTTLGMIASQSAYSGGEEWLDQCVSYIDGNHDFVQAYFKQNNMGGLIKMPAKAQGTYLTWVDCTALGEKIGAKQMAMDAAKSAGRTGRGAMRPPSPEQMIQNWLEKTASVQLNAGSSYQSAPGHGADGHMRMNIATSRKTLKAALDALSDACKKA
jgi:cystathionine beta-lyase